MQTHREGSPGCLLRRLDLQVVEPVARQLEVNVVPQLTDKRVPCRVLVASPLSQQRELA